MAKQNTRADTPSGQAPPTEEQSNDLLLILDKENSILEALAKAEKKEKYRTVSPDKENNNQFLHINGSENWFEAFGSNFWNQFKDPTRFGLIRIKESELDDPLVKQAISDIREGKNTKAVTEFIEKYELTAQQIQNINQLITEKMAKQENNQNTGVVEDNQPPRYRFNDAMVDWDGLKNYGLSREYLEQKGYLDQMMRGYKTNELVPIAMDTGAATFRGDARLSFRQDDEGRIKLNVHMLRQHPELDRPFMGHVFSDEDKKNLLNQIPEKETGNNMGRVVPLRSRSGEYVDSIISLDKLTNEIVAMPVSSAFIPDELSGVKLTDHEKNELREGRAIYIEGMTSKAGNDFNAHLQLNAERRGIEYLFPKQLKMEYGQELGKVKLSNKQVDALNDGRAIFVEDMVSKNGNQFSSYIQRDEVSGRLAYTRHNPDNPGEIYVPKEINAVKITPEEREQLREGKAIYLNDMVSNRGEEFSSYVRLDQNTGIPQYSRTLEGFDERREFKIPVEVFGVTLSAKQRADLQDGKPVLIEGMKGYGGKEFSQWAKVNQSGSKLNYFNENPDVKKDATQRNAVAAAPKQDAKQDKKKSRGHTA